MIFFFVNFVVEVGFLFGVVNIVNGFGSVVGLVIVLYFGIDKIVFMGFIVIVR